MIHHGAGTYAAAYAANFFAYANLAKDEVAALLAVPW